MTDSAPESLFAAVSSGDLETVEQLLESGANPLAVRPTRESVLRSAHARIGDPHGREIFIALRRAARAAIEASSSPKNGLGTPPHERRYTPSTERGVEDLRKVVEARKKLDVLLLECPLKAAARELVKLVQSPRREADVANRPVGDAQRLTFVFRLKGIEWTVVPFVFRDTSMWNVEDVVELAVPGSGIARIARALAIATESRAVHLQYESYTVYSARGGIETRSYEVSEDGVDGMSELGVFVPPMNVHTDGHGVQLELFGIDPSDVERVDVVVLQELGDAPVDRSVEQRAAPSRVEGAPPPRVPTTTPSVEEPPLRAAAAGPKPSAPPPLVNEPPPVVNEPPPMANEPPPVVNEPVVENEPPPVVNEPPPAVAEPDATPAGAPPMVNAPPPIVTAPVTPNDGEQ